MGRRESDCEIGIAIFGIVLVEMSGRFRYVDFCNNTIYFGISDKPNMACKLQSTAFLWVC